MKYTARFCHLAAKPPLYVGDVVKRGDIIGLMGNSGASDGAHLHIDCIEGVAITPWRLADMEAGRKYPAYKQINYFIDRELFGTEIEITTHFNDPEYLFSREKTHLAYDVVPKNRHETTDNYDIHWNRSHPGAVVAVGYDNGYGNYIHITFEA